MNTQLIREITLQRDFVLEDIFGKDRIENFSSEDKDELYTAVLIDLINRYANLEYFGDTEEYIDDLMRDIHDGVNPYTEDED